MALQGYPPAGTKVVAHGEIEACDDAGARVRFGEGFDACSVFFSRAWLQLASELTDGLPLKVGDRVKHISVAALRLAVVGEVMAVSYGGRHACVQWSPDTTTHLADGGFMTYPVADLVRA